MEYGLIGEKLGHSFSKEIHGLIGEYGYDLVGLTRGELADFLNKRDFRGINVTIPYKKDVIPYLDFVDGIAAETGAVNTVVNREGRLYGYNTDVIGLSELIKRVLRRSGKKDLGGLKVLVLGTGGTSQTAVFAAKTLKAKEIFRVSRSCSGERIIGYGDLSRHTDAGMIINCTPCGMYPDSEGCPISLDGFSALVGVVDVVYNPLKTVLILEAEKRKIPAEGGLYMLVSQAVAAYRHFTGKKTERRLTDKIFKTVLVQKENIVLIGMPSSGKTTVGKILAKRLNRKLVDTDRLIAAKEGRKIPEIFADNGEEYFRAAEKSAIAEASAENGIIIATGGGAVLDPANIDRLRSNGRIFWLDRPLSQLMPTEGRPTASSAEAMTARYNERYPIYSSRCDVRVDASDGFTKTVSKIIGRYKTGVSGK